jgi:4-hydroxybenzoate polyprenyltransferase
MIEKPKDQPIDDSIPLVVDLDGTFIYSDLFFEGIILLLKKNLFYLFNCLLWLLKGRVYFKNRIYENVYVSYTLLPYNIELLKFLKTESENGRKIVLATASLKAQAVEIAKLYPIFEEVYGTENLINLKGSKKEELLVKKFGKGKFDYIGNSHADLKIFASCRYSYLVNPSKFLLKETGKISILKNVWEDRKESWTSYIKAIRAYQWVKNLLVFVPLITSHSFNSLNLIILDLKAFVSFSLIASSGYLINDLLDVNSDRSHPTKRNRPLASGELKISSATILLFILMVGGLYIAASISILFLTILLLYFITSITYSLFIKKIALYDVFVLALLYSLRIFAGGVVIDVSLSFWLIAFSTFIFLSLAFIKRYSELIQIDSNENSLKTRGRQYSLVDLELLQMMGIVSGFMSAIVFSLYINSNEVVKLYQNPKLLWGMSLLFLFWISRMWLITVRGSMTDDPIIFAIKDRTSYVVFLLTGFIIVMAM